MHDDLFFFVNRTEAGEKLAAMLLEEPLIQQTSRDDLLVLSIPRGGVVVGAAVAQVLGCKHQVIVVKKIGFPGHKELAIGAVAEDETVVLGQFDKEKLTCYIEQTINQVKPQIETFIQKFRHGKPLNLQSKTVIIVDDGIATGETMKAAVIALTTKPEAQRPNKVIVAVPVCSYRSAQELQELADKFIVLHIPIQFWAVGQFYWDFDQVSDEEVMDYLLP